MRRIIGFLAGFMLLVVACGDTDRQTDKPSPTPPFTASPTVILAAPTQTPGGPTLTPSPTVPPTVTATVTLPPVPPTETPLPTETPGPYEHVLQPGDDCIGIVYQYGHNDFQSGILDLFLELNNLSSCRLLPGPGSVVLVPRPTFTPTPAGADLTQTAVATSAPPMVTLQSGPNYSVQPYTVQEGDTLSSIAIINETSLRQLCELNQGPEGIDCRGCQWESANCCCPVPPVLSVGQQINVPAPTPTPTFTPTFTGSETPTYTPTHRAPQPVYPTNGATIAGPVRLTWLTVGALADGEYYLVTLRDETTGAVYTTNTRHLSLDVPNEYLPMDGTARTFVWQVTVARLGADGLFYPTGPAISEQQFLWRGWE